MTPCPHHEHLDAEVKRGAVERGELRQCLTAHKLKDSEDKGRLWAAVEALKPWSNLLAAGLGGAGTVVLVKIVEWASRALG